LFSPLAWIPPFGGMSGMIKRRVYDEHDARTGYVGDEFVSNSNFLIKYILLFYINLIIVILSFIVYLINYD